MSSWHVSSAIHPSITANFPKKGVISTSLISKELQNGTNYKQLYQRKKKIYQRQTKKSTTSLNDNRNASNGSPHRQLVTHSLLNLTQTAEAKETKQHWTKLSSENKIQPFPLA